MAGTGMANSSARLFSNPAGDYGSMVNERVGAGKDAQKDCALVRAGRMLGLTLRRKEQHLLWFWMPSPTSPLPQL